jgi:hypothetical protein
MPTPHADGDLMEITGNAETIVRYQKQDFERKEYKYLKVSVMGNQVKNFSYCCLYFLITMIIIFFFPIFLICTDCCRTKIYQLFNLDLNVYEAIGRIISDVRPQELYLVIQDNYFNETKCAAIGRALETADVHKFEFVNTAQGFNVYGHNYADFPLYAQQWKDMVAHTRIRWASKAL